MLWPIYDVYIDKFGPENYLRTMVRIVVESQGNRIKLATFSTVHWIYGRAQNTESFTFVLEKDIVT